MEQWESPMRMFGVQAGNCSYECIHMQESQLPGASWPKNQLRGYQLVHRGLYGVPGRPGCRRGLAIG